MSKRADMVAAHLAAMVGDVPLAVMPSRVEWLRGVLTGAVRVDVDPTNATLRAFMQLRAQPAPPFAMTDDGIATIAVHGMLVKHADDFDEMFFGLTSYARVHQALDAALADERTRGLLFDFESPGGTVVGDLPKLSAAMHDAAGRMPVVAVANETAASGAYWLASAAGHVVTSEFGDVGSIGAFLLRPDITAALAKDGIKIEMVTTGAGKADRMPSQPFTAEERAALETRVTQAGDALFRDVSTYRGLSVDAIKALDGRTFRGAEAVSLGLADSVGTLEDGLAVLRAQLTSSTTTRTPGRTAASTRTEEHMEAKKDEGTAAAKTEDNVVSLADAIAQRDAALATGKQEGEATGKAAGLAAAQAEHQEITAVCAMVKRPLKLGDATIEPEKLAAHFIAKRTSVADAKDAVLNALADESDAAEISGRTGAAGPKTPATEISMEQVEGYYAKRREATAQAAARRSQPVTA